MYESRRLHLTRIVLKFSVRIMQSKKIKIRLHLTRIVLKYTGVVTFECRFAGLHLTRIVLKSNAKIFFFTIAGGCI